MATPASHVSNFFSRERKVFIICDIIYMKLGSLVQANGGGGGGGVVKKLYVTPNIVDTTAAILATYVWPLMVITGLVLLGQVFVAKRTLWMLYWSAHQYKSGYPIPCE